MNPTVLGALIGVGGSTVAQSVAGIVSSRRHRRELGETRLRELARTVEGADAALTEALQHLGAAAAVAQEVGASAMEPGERWEPERQRFDEQLLGDENALWTHSNLLRLRVPDDGELLRGFDEAARLFGEAVTLVEELLEPGERPHREPVWRSLREVRAGTVSAQRAYESAAQQLIGLARRPSSAAGWGRKV